MRINLSRFKKTKEDEKSATLKDDRGHEITLSKKSLRPELLKTLANLPVHMVDGGEAYSEDVPFTKKMGRKIGEYLPEIGHTILDPYLIPLKATVDAARGVGNIGAGVAEGAGVPISQVLPQGAPVLADQAAVPASVPQMDAPAQAPTVPAIPQQGQFADPYDMYMKGMNQQMAANNAIARETGNLAQRQIPAYHEAAESQKAALTRFNEETNYVADEHRRIVQDIRNNLIKPNQYLENLDAGQRSNMAIGILLSGAGAGLSGKENLALKFLDDQINRNIRAQEKNLASHENLLSANMQYYGNMRDALTATRAQLQEITANQILEEGAKSAYPFAKAKADLAAGALKQAAAQAIPDLAMARMKMKYMNQGVPGGEQGKADPASRIRQLQFIGAIKPEQAEHAYKQLAEAQKLDKLRNNALGIFDQVSGMNTLKGNVMSPIQTPKRIDALVEPLIAQLSKDTAGRFTEADAEMLRHLVKPDLTADAKTRAIQRHRLNQLISERMTFPELDALQIPYGTQGRFDESGQSRFKEGAAVKPK